MNKTKKMDDLKVQRDRTAALTRASNPKRPWNKSATRLECWRKEKSCKTKLLMQPQTTKRKAPAKICNKRYKHRMKSIKSRKSPPK